MALTKIQPSGINTSANFTFANANITSNLVVGGKSNLGPAGNLIITGGTANYVLSTDGAGNLSWVAQTGGGGGNSISNGNSNVNIPVANGNIAVTVAGNSNIAVFTGTGVNIAGTGNFTSNLITGGNLNVSGNAVVSGNLTVDGNLVYVNVTDLSVEDPIIQLQTGPNATPPTSNSGKDVGTALNYYDTSAKIAWMGWDVSNAEIAFGANVGISSEVVTFTSLANIRSGNANLGNLVSANFFSGNGSLLTGLPTAAGIANGNSNVNIPAANGNINLSASGNANVVVVTGTGINVAGTGNFTGNLGAANFVAGSGAGGNITGANVIIANTLQGNLVNGNSNIVIQANSNINISSTGNANVVVISGTGVNVAGTGNFSGNLSAGNFVAGTGVGGNISGANVISSNTVNISAGLNVTGTSNLGPVGNVIITGGSSGQYLQTNGSGGLSWATVSGTSISNGNSNVNIPAANGNVNISAEGNANIVVITGTGANITGTLNTTGNITGANASLGNLVTANFVQGVLTTASQPNITSVGTLGSLTTTGNVSVGGNLSVTAKSNLGAVGNVIITGGTANYVLSTDGAGNLSWVAQTGGGGGGGASISNGNSNINIASSGGNIAVAVTGVSNTVIFTDTSVNTSVQISSNVATGNAPFVVESTTVVANLNADLVDGFNASSAAVLNTVVVRDSNANIAANNISGTLSTAAQPNITSVGTLTALTIAGTGSVSGANLVSANFIQGTLTTASQPNITSLGTLGSLTATGNITGGNFVGQLANGNSNVSIPAANGNVNISAAGNANVVVVTGNSVSVNGNLTATTIISGAGSGGNITNANIISANLFLGSSVTVSAVTGLTSTGNANASTLTGNLGLRALAGTYTDNSAAASATLANAAVHGIGTLTLAAANTSVTATNAASFFIQGAPIAGANMTITNPYSLFVASGASFFGGNVVFGSDIVGILSNGTSNISIPAINGNINFSVGGVANEVVITSTGINVFGTGNFTGNVVIANLTVSGNISNTRITTRIANNGATTSGNITPTADTADQYNIIGLTDTANIQIPSGTASDGQKLTLRIKDNGTSRTLNWVVIGANCYRQVGTTLPANTTANKVSYVGCIYNSQDSFWDVIGVSTEL